MPAWANAGWRAVLWCMESLRKRYQFLIHLRAMGHDGSLRATLQRNSPSNWDAPQDASAFLFRENIFTRLCRLKISW